MTVFIVEEIHLGWACAPGCQIWIQEKNVLPQFSADVHLNSTGVSAFAWPRAHGDCTEGWLVPEWGQFKVECPGLPSTWGTMTLRFSASTAFTGSHLGSRASASQTNVSRLGAGPEGCFAPGNSLTFILYSLLSSPCESLALRLMCLLGQGARKWTMRYLLLAFYGRYWGT